jgi:hypothetical protein
MYLCHTALEMSITRASIAFGRDRSTIAHACHRIEDQRDDPAAAQWSEGLETLLRMAPSPGALRGVEAPSAPPRPCAACARLAPFWR